MDRVPQVGDWIKSHNWDQWYEVKRITGGIMYIEVPPYNNLVTYNLEGEWFFRDPRKVIKYQSGFAAFTRKINGSTNGDSK